VEIDRTGATLGMSERPGQVVRASWHEPCENLTDLHIAIAHRPLPWAGALSDSPGHRRPG